MIKSERFEEYFGVENTKKEKNSNLQTNNKME